MHIYLLVDEVASLCFVLIIFFDTNSRINYLSSAIERFLIFVFFRSMCLCFCWYSYDLEKELARRLPSCLEEEGKSTEDNEKQK